MIYKPNTTHLMPNSSIEPYFFQLSVKFYVEISIFVK